MLREDAMAESIGISLAQLASGYEERGGAPIPPSHTEYIRASAMLLPKEQLITGMEPAVSGEVKFGQCVSLLGGLPHRGPHVGDHTSRAVMFFATVPVSLGVTSQDVEYAQVCYVSTVLWMRMGVGA